MDRTNYFFAEENNINSFGDQMRKVGSDSLKAMSDYELDRAFKDIKSQIYRIHEKLKRKFDKPTKQWLRDSQVEYCYVAREIEARKNRKTAHEMYLSQKTF